MRKLTAIALFTTVAAAPVAAMAQGSNSDDGVDAGLGDIVVTAQRKSENLQKVPIVIQAFSAEKLQASGISTTADLAIVTPGLVLSRGVGLSSPYIRGIGNGSNGPGVENSVGLYVDGVYYASKAGAMAELDNVERVEVLKGPQGTLFGRNNTGGLIQIITKDPTVEPSFSAKVGYGNYDTVTASGYISGSLTDNVKADVLLSYRNQGEGWGKNIVTGSDANYTNNFYARSKMVLDLNDDTKIVLAGDYIDYESDVGINVHVLDGLLGTFGYDYTGGKYGVGNNDDQLFRSKAGGGSMTLTHDLGDVTLTSISAYRKTKYNFVLDADASPLSFLTFISAVEEKQLSQELQLAGGDGGPLQWQVGGYYFSNKSNVTTDFTGIFTRNAVADVATKSWAAYAQGTYSLAETTRVTAGLRYTTERRTIEGAQLDAGVQTISADDATTFNKLTWRIALEQDLARDVLGYLSYNRGFRSGGYNPGTLSNPAFRPEVLDAYEVGIKSTLFDRRLRFNVGAFYYDFQDIQLSQFILGTQFVRNAASAELYGVDVDFEALLTEGLTLSGGVEYLKATYKDFEGATFSTPLPGGGNSVAIGNAKGNDIVRTPRWTGNLSLDYSLPVGDTNSLDFNVTYSYNDGWYPEPDNLLRQDAYSLVNARVSFNFNDHASMSVWGRNLTNKFYYTILTANSLASVGSPEAPRTYGITLETKF